MTPATEALARRAVAAPGWRWAPGMRATIPIADQEAMGADWVRVCEDDSVTGAVGALVGGLPDLDDAATIGCLLALVREAWLASLAPDHAAEMPAIWVQPYHKDFVRGWAAIGEPSTRLSFGATEAEALVAALEAVRR